MAVNVTIKSKGLFKKELKMEDVLLGNMRYGIMDENYRLDEGKVGEYTVIFNNNHICRGYEITLKKGEINLSMPLPTSNEDIEFFYEYIKILCEKMKTKTFIREDEETSFDKIDEFIQFDTDASIRALEQIEENLDNGEYANMYIFGARNPISLGKKELSKINKDPKKLGKVMHELQNMDIYYAAPKVFQKNDKTLFGVYTLTENIPSVLPYKANLFMNNELKIDEWHIGFVIEGKLSGIISYNDFIDSIKKDNEYDSEHFIISLKRKEMDDLLEKYKIEL